jgi:hypothetical protein
MVTRNTFPLLPIYDAVAAVANNGDGCDGRQKLLLGHHRGRADGKQIGARVSPVDDPIYGEFYKGQPEPAQGDPGLIRPNEGSPLKRT